MKKSWPVYIIACFLLVESFGYALQARADGAEELNRLLGTKTEGSAGMVLGTAGAASAPAAATTVAPAVNTPAPTASAVAVANEDIIKLTPDKTHVLRLDQDAASVIVANPEHADVVLDSSRLLVIMPRRPGATSFTVLNANGETILEKAIVISGVQPHYVRVRRACSGQDTTCAPSAYYYCPDGCYEVSTVAPASGTDVPEVVGGAPAAFENQPVAPPANVPPQLPSIPLSNDETDEPTEPEGDE